MTSSLPTGTGGTGSGITRREAVVAAVVGLAAVPALADPFDKDKKKDAKPSGGNRGGQTPRTPPNATPANQPPPPPAAAVNLDSLVTRGRSKDWICRVTLGIRDASPGLDKPHRPEDIVRQQPLTFNQATILFPVIASSSSHETVIDRVTSVVRLDSRDQKITPQFVDKLPMGSRMGRWDLGKTDARAIEVEVTLPMTTWETVFDEKLAARVSWPPENAYPELAASALGPQLGVNPKLPAVDNLVKDWSEGKDPRSIPPITMAKYFASKVVQNFRASGSGRVGDLQGRFVGLDVRELAEVLKAGRGNEHEIPCILAAVYRAAGLPARLVIGYDLTKTRGSGAGFPRGAASGTDVRTWVEFCVIDRTKKEPTPVWVPVDVVRQQSAGSRAPALDQPWRFFGGIKDLETVLPMAFHFIPPTNVISHGYPLLWGWNTQPSIKAADQSLRFDASSAPRIGNEPIFRRPPER